MQDGLVWLRPRLDKVLKIPNIKVTVFIAKNPNAKTQAAENLNAKVSAIGVQIAQVQRPIISTQVVHVMGAIQISGRN